MKKMIHIFILNYLLVVSNPMLAQDSNPLDLSVKWDQSMQDQFNILSPDRLSFRVSNDAFAVYNENYDRNMTNVLYLSVSYDELPDFLDFLVRDPAKSGLLLSIAHHMYTPDDLTISQLQPDDHPYAGHIYLAISVVESPDSSTQKISTLQIGVIGPMAFAEELQRQAHVIFAGQDPQGWEYQLNNEPTLNFSQLFAKKFRKDIADLDDFNFEIVGSAGYDVGNVLIGANSTGMLRVGYRIPDDFGIRPIIIDDNNKRFRAYLTLGAQQNLVLSDIFIEGNKLVSKKDSHPGLDLNHYSNRAWLSFTVAFGPFSLVTSYGYRSPEFKGQSLGGDWHGEIGLFFQKQF